MKDMGYYIILIHLELLTEPWQNKVQQNYMSIVWDILKYRAVKLIYQFYYAFYNYVIDS